MRVGAISFLNALPLIHGLPWPLRRLPPSALQSALLRGDFDLALCSVTTALCHEGLYIVPGAAIGSRGAVNSVRLVFYNGTDIQSVRRIALDPESNTANLLLHILLIHYFSRRDTIRFVSDDSFPDASLVIGDRALTTDRDKPSLDLGALWTEWTGLPFVFAAWLTPSPTIARALADQLTTTRDNNLANLPDLLRCLPVGAIPAEALAYLRTHISYRLGETELAGLREFQRYAISCAQALDRPIPFATIA